jgi:hypothetical protein
MTVARSDDKHGDNKTNRPQKVSTILCKPKKGSKPYREILGKSKTPKKPLNSNIFKKFCSLVDITLEPNPILFNFNRWWTYFGTSNKLREFIFKFCNNLLGINSRVNHFNRLVDEACTFCTARGIFPAPRETFLHLFFNCQESYATLSGFEQKYLNELRLDSENKKKNFWFFGSCNSKLKDKKAFFHLTAGTILYYIWDCKLRKSKQSLSSCLNFYFYHMEIVRKVSSALRAEMNEIDLDLCRFWNGERPRGW